MRKRASKIVLLMALSFTTPMIAPAAVHAQTTVQAQKQLKKQNIPLKKIRLNQTSVKMEVNSLTKLEVSYIPSNTTVKKKITWISSKPKVVKVKKDGTIQSLSVGKAVITAIVSGKKATCKITVKKAAIPEQKDGYTAPDSSIIAKDLQEQIKKDIEPKELAQWTTEKSEIDYNYIVPIYSVKTSDLKSGTLAKKLKFTKEYAILVQNFEEQNQTTMCKIRQINGTWHIYGLQNGDEWATAINSLPDEKTYYVEVKGHELEDFLYTNNNNQEYCYSGSHSAGEMSYGLKQTVKAYWKTLRKAFNQ